MGPFDCELLCESVLTLGGSGGMPPQKIEIEFGGILECMLASYIYCVHKSQMKF